MEDLAFRLNFNLEVLVFVGGGGGGRKTGELREKPLEQEPTSNSTHMKKQVWESNPGHRGGRQVFISIVLTMLSQRFGLHNHIFKMNNLILSIWTFIIQLHFVEYK